MTLVGGTDEGPQFVVAVRQTCGAVVEPQTPQLGGESVNAAAHVQIGDVGEPERAPRRTRVDGVRRDSVGLAFGADEAHVVQRAFGAQGRWVECDQQIHVGLFDLDVRPEHDRPRRGIERLLGLPHTAQTQTPLPQLGEAGAGAAGEGGKPYRASRPQADRHRGARRDECRIPKLRGVEPHGMAAKAGRPVDGSALEEAHSSVAPRNA